MKKTIVIGVLCFIAGFFFHALVFPDLFILNLAPQTVQNAGDEPRGTSQKLRDLVFLVTYEKGMFHPSRVVLEKGQYIAVRNMNKDALMWLVSTEKTFNATRGLGQSEELRNIYSEAKTFTVADKLNPQAVLTVTVK